MSLPRAVQYTHTIPSEYAGFSVPGIEIDGPSCGETTCRPRWVNRQDHGNLTQINRARANHPGVAYSGPDRELSCSVGNLRTEVYGPGAWGSTNALAGSRTGAAPVAGQAREMVAKLRQGARARANKTRAVAGCAVSDAVAGNGYMRQRRTWGNQANHGDNTSAASIRYIPVAGVATTNLDNIGFTMEEISTE